MKIGLDKDPGHCDGTYCQHLAKVLELHAPEHEYIVDRKHYKFVDLYHGFKYSLPLAIRLRRIPSVLTVSSLNFLRHPEYYPLTERMFRLRGYRNALRAADRLIALSSPERDELAQRLGIAPERIEVVMPLGVPVPHSEPLKAELEHVGAKYSIPENFILMLGVVEPRHHHQELLDALLATDLTVGVVICSRRTAWSERLLRYVRDNRLTRRVEFIYELATDDLQALFSLARAFAYLPDASLEASIVPVVEALRTGVPMVLSDTPHNREAAGDGAVYVNPASTEELAAALENLLLDDSFREELRQRERLRAGLFSERAVARRLADIYSSL